MSHTYKNSHVPCPMMNLKFIIICFFTKIKSGLAKISHISKLNIKQSNIIRFWINILKKYGKNHEIIIYCIVWIKSFKQFIDYMNLNFPRRIVELNLWDWVMLHLKTNDNFNIIKCKFLCYLFDVKSMIIKWFVGKT